MSIQTCHEGKSKGDANGARRAGVFKAYASTSKGVDVGRNYISVAVGRKSLSP